jgi:hypothetical protein
MRFFTVITILLFLCVDIVQGQKDYYSTDSIMSVGVKLYNDGSIGNSIFCHVKKGDSIIKYSPEQVKEYGFGGGRIYISKEITGPDSAKIVFLERLVDGKTALYYYKGRDFTSYYLQKDSSALIMLPRSIQKRNDYNSQLTDLTSDCPDLADASKLVAYKKKSLAKFISRYNICELKPFPFIRYGVFMGMIQSRIILKPRISDDLLNNFTFSNDNSFYYGLFTDIPILASDFSAFIGMGFYKSSFSSNYRTNTEDNDILIHQSTIKIPVLVTYTLPLLKYRPYFNLGVNYSYNIRNSSTIYKAGINNNIVQFEPPVKEDLTSASQLGFAVGSGIKFHLSYRRYIFAEIRYNMDFPVNYRYMLNKSSFELISGINF